MSTRQTLQNHNKMSHICSNNEDHHDNIKTCHYISLTLLLQNCNHSLKKLVKFHIFYDNITLKAGLHKKTEKTAKKELNYVDKKRK